MKSKRAMLKKLSSFLFLTSVTTSLIILLNSLTQHTYILNKFKNKKKKSKTKFFFNKTINRTNFFIFHLH